MSDGKLDLDRMVEKYIWLGAEEYSVCGLVCDYIQAECMYDILGLSLVYPIIHHTCLFMSDISTVHQYKWRPHFSVSKLEKCFTLPLLDLWINFYE